MQLGICMSAASSIEIWRYFTDVFSHKMSYSLPTTRIESWNWLILVFRKWSPMTLTSCPLRLALHFTWPLKFWVGKNTMKKSIGGLLALFCMCCCVGTLPFRAKTKWISRTKYTSRESSSMRMTGSTFQMRQRTLWVNYWQCSTIRESRLKR